MNDCVQRIALADDYQCSGEGLGHVSAGLHYRCYVEGVVFFFRFQVKELQPSSVAGLGAETEEKLPYLALENDYDCYHADGNELVEYLAEQFHIQKADYFPCKEDQYEPDEDADCVCAFQQFVKVIKQQGYDEYVYQVGDSEGR